MSYFNIKPASLKDTEEAFGQIGDSLERCSEEIQAVSTSLKDYLSNADLVGTTLNRISGKVQNQANTFRQFGQGMEKIALLYSSTENEIANGKNSKNVGTGKKAARKKKNSRINTSGTVTAKPDSKAGSGWRFSGRKVEGSVFEKSVNAPSGIIGGSAGFGFLNGRAETKGGASLKYKNGRLEEASIGVSAGAEGSLVKGNAEGNIGFVKGKVKGNVGEGSTKGEIGASLYKGGKLSPAVKAKVEAKAKGASGEASLQAGDDNNNINAKASGSLANAEASAGAQAGVITYKDSNTGELKQTLGIEGEVGAEAYLAEGKIAGGLTIFGVKVNVSASGKAGGAGIGAKGRVGIGCVSGEIKAGLGIGAGLKVDIDWSNFKWPWER